MSTKFEREYLAEIADLPWQELAFQSWSDYDAIATANEDPLCRSQVRLGRESFRATWQRIVGGAYEKAKTMGFNGDWNAWQKEVKRFGHGK